MSKVSIIKCTDYNKDRVYSAVKQSVDYLGGIEKYIKKGERVLIKPNLLSMKTPDKAVTTHPEVLRAVIRLVKEAGATPFVGDSPGGKMTGYSGSFRKLANPDQYWQETGMKAVCGEEGAEIVSFETGGSEVFELKNRKHVKTLRLSKTALSFDSIIDVPKLKTHGMVLFTGAIKNLFGCVSGLTKAEYHKQAVHPEAFSRMLVDIFSIVKPKLGIFDAVEAMDGNGPSSGRVKKVGVILASADCVALDTVGSMVLGFKSAKEISAIRLAGEQGLGESDISKIEIEGEKLESVVQKDFIKPSNAALRNMSPIVGVLLNKFFWVYPKINEAKCAVCRVCVDNCPVKAINIKTKYPSVDRKKCIKCMCCHELCTYDAIDIDLSFLAGKIYRTG
ncbi:MAG: hypothetical protein A2252_07875 [Elusimicrobia bacterium RIFOXYA2_FULL_39_19]|nr:MAG: hypothetical protein A2252_07875 [Elusimicrobia bacterium RIFOXYA2_FULL_39_19]